MDIEKRKLEISSLSVGISQIVENTLFPISGLRHLYLNKA